MRYPPEHKEEVRRRLVTAASHALRRDGLDGLSIPALMKKAGLTHGGFYAHFDSKDALVAAAVDAAADDTAARVFGAAPDVAALADAYASFAHVDRAGDGCVVAALGGEGRRQPAVVRRSFARAARGLIDLVQQKLTPSSTSNAPKPNAPQRAPSDEALETTARLVGAVVLARLVDDDDLRDRLLAAARAAARR